MDVEVVGIGVELDVGAEVRPIILDSDVVKKLVSAVEEDEEIAIVGTKMHPTPTIPLFPELHAQLVLNALPDSKFKFAGQSLHTDSEMAASTVPYLPCKHNEHGADPFVSLYCPASHAKQSPPFGPV